MKAGVTKSRRWHRISLGCMYGMGYVRESHLEGLGKIRQGLNAHIPQTHQQSIADEMAGPYWAITKRLSSKATRRAKEVEWPSDTAEMSMPRRTSSWMSAMSWAARAELKPRQPT